MCFTLHTLLFWNYSRFFPLTLVCVKHIITHFTLEESMMWSTDMRAMKKRCQIIYSSRSPDIRLIFPIYSWPCAMSQLNDPLMLVFPKNKRKYKIFEFCSISKVRSIHRFNAALTVASVQKHTYNMGSTRFAIDLTKINTAIIRPMILYPIALLFPLFPTKIDANSLRIHFVANIGTLNQINHENTKKINIKNNAHDHTSAIQLMLYSYKSYNAPCEQVVSATHY